MLYPVFLPTPTPPFIFKEPKQMSLLESSMAVEYLMASLCIAIPCGCQNHAVSFALSQLKWLTLTLLKYN